MKSSQGAYLGTGMPGRRNGGFSLVELMIVLVIVGILTSIAYPNYQDYVARTRRTDGKAFLMDIAARQERYYADRNTYSTDLTDLGMVQDAGASAFLSKDGYYSATVAAGAGTITRSYVITVTPTAKWGGGGDAKCGNLTLDNLGTQGSSEGTVETCWR